MMVVTSISSASNHPSPIWPKRPKPMAGPIRAPGGVHRLTGRTSRAEAVEQLFGERPQGAEEPKGCGDGGDGGGIYCFGGRQHASDPPSDAANWRTRRRPHAGHPSGRGAERRVGPAPPGREQQPDDRRLEYGDDRAAATKISRGAPHDRQIEIIPMPIEDGAARQKAAERFDVGFQLVALRSSISASGTRAKGARAIDMPSAFMTGAAPSTRRGGLPRS